MTSATEVLRRLLDERGVEWEDCGNGATYVDHNGEAWRFDYDEPFDQLGIVFLSGYTPAQAIDATLGRGTCRIGRGTSGLMHVTTGHCSECGAEVVKPARYCPNCGRRVE